MIFFRSFKEGVHSFGEHIALIINSVLLLVVYLLGVGLTFLVARAFGKHFLGLSPSNNKKSYWSDLNLKKKSEDAYYRQF